jgi:acetyl esterase
MSLAPEVQQLADAMAAAMPGGLTSLPVEAMRQSVELTAVPSPFEVARVEDATVEGPGGAIPVRIYHRDPGTPSPVLIWLHGGGFVLGTLTIGDDICRRIASALGAVVVNVQYRLAPEDPYPAGLDDCQSVYQWAHSRPAELGPVTGRVAVGGDSAGGNLTMALAQKARDGSLAPMTCQLSVYGTADTVVTNPELGDVPFLTSEACHWFWNHYLPDPALRDDPYVNPARAADLSGLAPLMAITAEHDPTRDGTEAYARRVAAAGGQVIAKRYPGMAHGFFSMQDLQVARDALADAVSFLRDHLYA